MSWRNPKKEQRQASFLLTVSGALPERLTAN